MCVCGGGGGGGGYRPIARDVTSNDVISCRPCWRTVGPYQLLPLNTMVNFCSVVGCSKRSNRDKDVSFYRIPAEISHQGERTQELSKKRRDLWISRIGRADFQPNPHSRVCSRHFIGGKLVVN